MRLCRPDNPSPRPSPSRRGEAAVSWTVVVILIGFAPSAAHALPDWAPDWANKISISGTVSSDLRFEVEDYRGATPGQGYQFQANWNNLNTHITITPVDNVIGVVDFLLRFTGFNTATSVIQTNDPSLVDPSTLQLDQAYAAVRGFPFSNTDLKVGRMVQHWGSSDVFSPTDNLNAHDLYDVMDYSRKVGNEMVEIDVYPTSWLTLNAVWVPVFRPSILPDSAQLGYAIGYDANGCVTSTPPAPLSQKNAQQLQGLFSSVSPCSLNFPAPTVNLYLPENTFANSQAALRARLKLGGLDLGLSYYYGRFTFPVALDAVVFAAPSTTQPGKVDVNYTAEVMYPRMQVAGLDFNYSAPWFFDVGFVGELAVIFPEQVDFALRAYEGGSQIIQLSNVNVSSRPFIKATFGADYTFTKWLYLNVMYVHGFFDEFNDLYGIHNYVVAATQTKFWNDVFNLQLAGILDVDDLSNVFNPQLTWTVVPSVELLFGAFIFGGSVHPTYPTDYPLDYASRLKFGQPAAGRSVAYLKARLTW
jgi:hypothetical protein